MNLDILLSGEGPSDLGSIDSNGEFKEGPMTCLIKKIIGFLESDFKNGLAMVPKPTSEAWLICCLNKYSNCEQLENLPGNESSDRHPKKILNEVIRTEANTEILLEIACEKCDVEKIKMPSFIYFKEKLEKVLSDEVS